MHRDGELREGAWENEKLRKGNKLVIEGKVGNT